MARYRTYKAELFSDSKTGTLSLFAFKLFLGLMSHSDDRGVIRYNPLEFKAKILPYEQASIEECIIKPLNDELLAAGLVGKITFVEESRIFLERSCTLETSQNMYLYVCNFGRHQRVDKAGKSLLKDWKYGDSFDEYVSKNHIVAEIRGTFQEYSKNVPELFKNVPAVSRVSSVSSNINSPVRSAHGEKLNPSQFSKGVAQTRFARIQEMILTWYREWTNTDCPWDGGEAKALSKMLKAWPNVPDEQFADCLHNLALSDCIAKGSRPREWLEKLPKFVAGPLDEFWHSKGVANGRKATTAQRTTNTIHTTTGNVFGTAREDTSKHAASLPHSNDGRGIGDVEGHPKKLLSSGDRGGDTGVNPQSTKTGAT